MTEGQALKRIANICDQIQELHAEARNLADLHGIEFDITLDGGQYADTIAEYLPYANSWDSSSC
ncbi:hypothetical protein D3C80_435210 [compost metagenome]